jgi:hypothetical protein
MHFAKVFCALALCAGCTLSTDAGDREIADRLDFDFTLTAMSPHRRDQLDVALVVPLQPDAPLPGATDLPSATPKYALRGRARVLVPGNTSDTLYPDMTVRLRRVIQDGPWQALFYVDTKLDNNVEPLGADGKTLEHTWVRNVPASGELGFYHEFIFENFYDSEISGIGGDIVLDVPVEARAPARMACLDQRLKEIMKSSLEVRLVFNPNTVAADVGYFKMHGDNDLPGAPIRLEGIADTNSEYGIDIYVDGVRSAKVGTSAPATNEGLTIPLKQWLAVDNAAIDACLAL